MSYSYAQERARLFTEDGIDYVLKVRTNAHRLLRDAGAFTLERVIDGVTGDTFTMQAAVDYLVESGEIVELPVPGPHWGQDRVFTSRRRSVA